MGGAIVVTLAVLLACGGVPKRAAEAGGNTPGLPTAVATPGATIALDGVVVADKDLPAPFTVSCKASPLIPDDFKAALAAGGQHVRVKVPQLEEPLYGVLSLCNIPSNATGPASRAHRIQIPEEFVAATEGGRISVVFEEVAGTNGATSWQLFLSRAAFPSADLAAAAAAERVGEKAKKK